MKITIYTVNDCKFSQEEKTYLTSKNLPFEEKNLETNREFLTEMLNISNNFAGTPVTKIEKDDGQVVVLKGFTQAEFDSALGFSSDTTVTVPQEVSSSPVTPPTIEEPVQTQTPAQPDSPTPQETEQTPADEVSLPPLPRADSSAATPPMVNQPTDIMSGSNDSMMPDDKSNSPDTSNPLISSTPSSPTDAGSSNMQSPQQPMTTDNGDTNATTSPTPTATEPAAPQSPMDSVLNNLKSKANS